MPGIETGDRRSPVDRRTPLDRRSEERRADGDPPSDPDRRTGSDRRFGARRGGDDRRSGFDRRGRGGLRQTPVPYSRVHAAELLASVRAGRIPVCPICGNTVTIGSSSARSRSGVRQAVCLSCGRGALIAMEP